MSTTTRRRLVPAREYLRVSFDRSGRQRSPGEQHADNLAAARREGWKLGQGYSDEGSASRFARNGRDGYDALVADLDAGRFGAELLVLWESSRGSRKVGDWVELIELCEREGVRIAVTTHGPRVYDPANPRDRRALLEDAVDSEYESAKTSLRSRRAAAANADAGRPHGVAPYGYRRVYDPATGRLDGQVPDPAEAAVVVEAFERVGAGDSLKRVAADLAARGVVGRRGKPMTAATLRPMLLNATYAGQRVHAPGTRSASQRRGNRDEVRVFDAAWPALVEQELFLTVRHKLTDPSRRTSRPGRGVHLLSMIARCHPCGAPLAATYRSGRRQYQCHGLGCVRVDADDLDVLARQKVLEFLLDPGRVERLTAGAGDGKALAAARAEVASVRAELDDLADRVGRGELSATFAARSEPQILARLAAAERRVEELVTPPALSALVTPDASVAAAWANAPMPAAREVTRLLLVPEHVGELRVTRSPTPGYPVPVVSRVVWHREGGDEEPPPTPSAGERCPQTGKSVLGAYRAGCRCGVCRAANAARKQAWKNRRRAAGDRFVNGRRISSTSV